MIVFGELPEGDFACNREGSLQLLQLWGTTWSYRQINADFSCYF
jgi:hypothetical protein